MIEAQAGWDKFKVRTQIRAQRAGLVAIAASLLLAWSACDGPDIADREKGKPVKAAAPIKRVELVWPTPSQAFAQGHGYEAFVQPTVSGEPTSGLFGSVRSGGRQFHEGLDIAPIARDAKGEATDAVGAALAGVVRHIATRPGASSYGRYVVLEHPNETPAVYTLYAHLADIAPGLHVGQTVAAGERLGRMGRSSSGTPIPKERAHLHFEIGLRLSDQFAAWYRDRKFGSPNEQGLYNGMNLVGVDPWAFFTRHRAGDLFSVADFLAALPTAVTVRFADAGEPNFLRRYPALRQPSPADAAASGGGWEVDCGASGVPLRWRRLGAEEFIGWRTREIRVVAHDAALLAENRGRTLVVTKKGRAQVGEDLQSVLELAFGLKG